jgi:phosphoglycerate dehydrogenase-like enzyme
MKVLIYTRPPEFASSITVEHWDRALQRNALHLPDLDIVLCHTSEDLLANLPGTEIVVSSKADLKDFVLPTHTTIKLIFFAFAGVDHLAPFTWVPRSAHVVNNSGATGHAIGEYAVWAMHLLANNIVRGGRRRFIETAAQRGFASLSGRIVTIIGVGGVGSGVAALCKTFRMRVRGVRRSAEPAPSFDETYPADRLEEAMGDAEFVVLACPVTSETRQLFNAAMLARMKPGAFLINVARGAIVDEEALCNAIDNGALGGAVLDVVSAEASKPDARVLNTTGILVTPHVSGDDAHHYIDNSLDVLAHNLRQFLAGDLPANAIDFNLGY